MQLIRPVRLIHRSAVPFAVLAVAGAALAGCSSSSSSSTPPPATPAPSPILSTSPSGVVTPVKAAKPPKPVCPLTGLAPTKGESRQRVALAVKIDNVAPALPQSGVNNADVVVEELVEGGLTRLMAIFQCNTSKVVGPIRSARISDADVLALLHGSVLGYSGANPKDLPPIIAHSDSVLISQDSDPQYFYRSAAKAAPHNVFSSTTTILKAGLARRHHLKAPKPLFSYGPIDPSARAAHAALITWPAASAHWDWSKNQWLRTQDGEPDKLASGQRISATNVVVMSVNIASTGLRDVLGTPSPLDVTVQRKPMPLWVLRNGKVIKGTWTRPKISSPLIFRDHAGKIIDLAPGRTWLEFLPTPGKPTISRH
jgi:hypothetical protein